MPTAAKLVAAIVFAALAYLAAEVYKLGVPERTVWGLFGAICAAIGGLCGWFVMGRLAGRGYGAAMGYGLRTTVTFVFWIVLAFSTYQMILRSMSLRYGGPMEAIIGVFDLMIEYGQSMATGQLGATLLTGGILAGVVVEWAGRRWK
jgi:hypothetical protein